MVIWSALRSALSRTVRTPVNSVVLRNMSGDHHRVLPLQPSKWQWNKFKDLIHYYVLLGVIPLTALVTLTNIFVGPATLTEIPEGYTPKHWEYYRHPISRFIARYVLTSPQQEYEKMLHHLFEEDEKRRIRMVETQVKDKMAERSDYQAYYYRPITAKYHRMTKDTYEYIETIQGD